MLRTLGVISFIASLVVAGCGDKADRDAAGEVDLDAETDRAIEAAKDPDTADADADLVGAASSAPDFATDAAIANLVEIRTSEIAEQRSQREDVKAFARMMISDHTDANDKLRTAAVAIALPAAPDAEAQAKIAGIQNADSATFDEDYLALQQEAHESAVSLFEEYAEGGDDASLKAFAAAALPTLQRHLSEVRGIRISIESGDDATGAGTGAEEDVEIQPDEQNRSDLEPPPVDPAKPVDDPLLDPTPDPVAPTPDAPDDVPDGENPER